MKGLDMLLLGRAERIKINCKPVDPNLRQSSVNSQAPIAEARGANEWEVTVSRIFIFSLYLSAGSVLSHMLPTLRSIVRHHRYIIVGVVAALGGVFRPRGS
jgi:hypothetical protein